MRDLIEEAAQLVARGRVVALTGAGISVESGIPDFRSRGGLWARFPPEEYATIQAFRRNPAKVWNMLYEMESILERARPNPGHTALADLERRGLLKGVITQNIDGLHQEAGSVNVVEFHGSHRTLSCLDCGRSYGREEALKSRPPACGCGFTLKPDVIFFGEMIPMRALAESKNLADASRVMLVVGTSAEVAPASQMPLIAKRCGATIIEINLETTGLTHSVTDLFIKGEAGKILPALAERAALFAD